MADDFEACSELERPEADADRDGLTDCEEMLIGTDISMVDTDGDGFISPAEDKAALFEARGKTTNE